jgi:hypothetical protein
MENVHVITLMKTSPTVAMLAATGASGESLGHLCSEFSETLLAEVKA